MLLVLVLRPKVLEKYQVHSSMNKYIVCNQKLYTVYRFQQTLYYWVNTYIECYDIVV